jgi:hypothetical protein
MKTTPPTQFASVWGVWWNKKWENNLSRKATNKKISIQNNKQLVGLHKTPRYSVTSQIINKLQACEFDCMT